MSRRCRRRLRGKSDGNNRTRCRVAPLLLGILAILALVGCSGSATPTSKSEPVADPTSVPTLAPAPAVVADPTSATKEDPTTDPVPTVDVPPTLPAPVKEPTVQAFPVPAGSRPHDVAPALDGGVWYTAQGSGELGWLDPETGETRHIPLGAGSRPHGVIVGPDGAPWVTDGGLNAILRVDPENTAVDVFTLPPERPSATLNTATFCNDGVLWFTGQNGI